MSYAKQHFSDDTYAYNDVRAREEIIKAFANWLVGLNIGLTIDSETEYIYNSTYTSSSSYYYLYLKYKNSDHLIRLKGVGGTGNYTMAIEIMSVGSTTSSLYSIGTPITAANNSTAALYAVVLYNDDGLILLTNSYSTSYPSIAQSGYVAGVACQVLEDFTDASVTTEYISCQQGGNGPTYLFGNYGYATGSDSVMGITHHSGLTINATVLVEKMAKAQRSGTNFQFRNLYNFTNALGAPSYNIITINSKDYVLYTTNYMVKIS